MLNNIKSVLIDKNYVKNGIRKRHVKREINLDGRNVKREINLDGRNTKREINLDGRNVKREINLDKLLDFMYDDDSPSLFNEDEEDDMRNTDEDEFSGGTMYIPFRENDPTSLILPNIFGSSDIVNMDNSQEDLIHKMIPVVNQPVFPTTISNSLKLPDPAKYPKDRGRNSIIIDSTDQLSFLQVVSWM